MKARAPAGTIIRWGDKLYMKTPMSRDTAHTSRWEIAEVVFGLPFLVAIGLQFLLPLTIPQGLLSLIIFPGGALLIAAGIGLIIRARQEFAKYGQPTDPGHPTTRVITTDVFSFSRNPLYLGAVCLLAGIALAFNMLWGLILLLPSVIACHYVLILPEEKYLVDKFGGEYLAYAAKVRRWIGRR